MHEEVVLLQKFDRESIEINYLNDNFQNELFETRFSPILISLFFPLLPLKVVNEDVIGGACSNHESTGSVIIGFIWTCLNSLKWV